MPDPQYDEYGIPVKKKQQEVDEFGIAIKKKGGGGDLPNGATEPLVDPAVKKRLADVTMYLNQKKGVQQDNLQLPANVKNEPSVLQSKLKKEQEKTNYESVIKNIKKPTEKPAKLPMVMKPETGTSIGQNLQAKYGANWQSKATEEEKNKFKIADSKERSEFYDNAVNNGEQTVTAPSIEDIEKKQLQKDADDFYNTAFGRLYWNIAKPIGATAEKIVGGTLATGTRLAGDVLGVDEVTDGIADWFSETLNPDEWDKDRVTRITPNQLKGGLFNNGKINTSLIVPKLAETLTTMFAITSGGGGTAGLLTRSFLIQQEDYRRDGKEAGLTGKDLDMYAYMGAGLTSALETISPNNLFTGQVKKQAAKEFYEAIQKGFSREVATKIATKTLVKETALENVQEFTQMTFDKGLRYFTDKMQGKPVFNDDLSWEGLKDEVYETLLLTTGATSLMSTPSVLRNSKPTTLEKSAWYNASLNPEKFNSYIDKNVANGRIPQEQAQLIKTNFDKYRGAVSQSQQLGYGADQTMDIAFEVYKGNEVAAKIKQVSNNPILKESVGGALKEQQQQTVENIKRIGMGVPEVGTEVTGAELSNIIENIGDKGGEFNNAEVAENKYRVEEVNVKELYNKDAGFKKYVDEYSRTEKNKDGLLVPAIINKEGGIVDGRSRLAQQYINGVEKVQVFKELKTDFAEDYNIVPPKVLRASIEIGGKMYYGKNHAEAILQAKAEGKDISGVNRQADGTFEITNEKGETEIIDRAKAKELFGADKSEMMIDQDEAADNANKEYRKITDGSGVGELIITDNARDVKDEITDEKIGETKYQDFSIDFEDGARAFGTIQDGVANISGINAPKNNEGVVRGTQTYERVLDKLKKKGIKTVNIKLQSNDSGKAIDKLIEKGVLTNARNVTGSSGNERPTQFDISEQFALSNKPEAETKEPVAEVNKEAISKLEDEKNAKIFKLTEQKGEDIKQFLKPSLPTISFSKAEDLSTLAKGDVKKYKELAKKVADLRKIEKQLENTIACIWGKN